MNHFLLEDIQWGKKLDSLVQLVSARIEIIVSE